MLVKVEMHSVDSSSDIQPRVDDLSIAIYKNIDLIADAGGFYMTPHSGTYTLSKEDNGILLRSRNLGITFVALSEIDSLFKYCIPPL